MADKKDIAVPKPDAGMAFRAEMLVNNFFLGYWKQLVTVAVLVLAAILVYGIWLNSVGEAQRYTVGEAAKVLIDLSEELEGPIPPPFLRDDADANPTLSRAVVGASGNAIAGPLTNGDRMAGFALSPNGRNQGAIYATAIDVKNTDGAADKIRAAAEKLEAIADEGSGVAAAETRLYAAELYRLLEDMEKRRALLTTVADSQSRGVLLATAQSGLAATFGQEGNSDEAVALYRQIMDRDEAFFAEAAAVDILRLYLELGDAAKATAALGELKSRWPDSLRVGPFEKELEARGLLIRDDPAPTDASSGSEEPSPEGDDGAGEG